MPVARRTEGSTVALHETIVKGTNQSTLTVFAQRLRGRAEGLADDASWEDDSWRSESLIAEARDLNEAARLIEVACARLALAQGRAYDRLYDNRAVHSEEEEAPIEP